MDDDFPIPLPTITDPVCLRGDALIRLAEAAENARDEDTREILIAFMDKVLASVRLPPTGQLVSLKGDRDA